MEFTKKVQDLKRGLPRFRHILAEHCRRLFAVVICASLVLSGFPSGFFQAFAADENGDYVFELDRTSIYEALDTAIADGTTLESELKFFGDHKDEYDELFEPDGTLYELEDLETDKDRERDKNVELRVFVRIEGDISLDEAYEVDGTEEVLFLLSNKTDDEISIKIVLDDRETEMITIPAAKDIPVEFDKDLSDEESEEIPATVELEVSPGVGGGAGSAAGGDGAYVDDEAADEADEEAAAEDAANIDDEESFASDAAEEDTDTEPTDEGSDKESEDGSDEESDKETSSDDSSDDDTDSVDKDSTEDKGSSHDRGFSGGRESSEDDRSSDKESSDKESADKESSDKGSSEDKDDSRDEGSSKDKESSDEYSSKENGSDKKDSSRSRGSSEKHTDDSSNEEKTASISINKNTFLMASVDLDYTETEPYEDAGAEEAASAVVEEADVEGSDDTMIIAASPSNASPSNASPSDASKIIDGTVYEPVRLGNRGAVAFITTTDDLGLTEDLDMITTLTYEGEDFIVTVSYGKDAGLPRDVELFASEYDKDSDTFQERLAEIAEFNDWDESRFEEKVVYDDEDDDEGHVESIVDRIRLFNVSLNSDGAEVEPEAEVEVQISLLDSEEPGENGGCYSVFHFADTEIEVIDPTNEYEDEIQTITFSVTSFSDIMLLSEDDPTFTVQFWANLDTIYREHHDGDTDLTVIETHTENGAVLPKNEGSTSASAYNTSVIEMTSAGKIDSDNVLTQMYVDEEYEFIVEPTVHAMNKVEKNSDYKLVEIWKLKDGKSSESTDKSDWDVYEIESTGEDTYSKEFTNSKDAADADPSLILVQDDDVFRFVYDTTSANAYLDANFYDYNIGNGTTYSSASTSGGTWNGSGAAYLYTAEQGINNASNYSGSGTKLAFGNDNTGTGLGQLTWSKDGLNNLPNKYNSGNGLLGCTFGIADSLDTSTNMIKFSDGINAPNLFGGDAIGKQTFSNNQLVFNREGDTYTLAAVSGSNGVGVDNLDSFNTTAEETSAYTNNFWPMDNVSYSGMDVKFGSIEEQNNSTRQFFGNSTGRLPLSDDHEEHNSYFGMNFDIYFEYTKDYVGPLEYFFFGDDDMWVFLDDQLVIDIGGVHSTVGEHVDLWDYLKNDTFNEDGIASHTLSVFYTERGASGSTCFIQYTLPEVSSVTPVEDASNLIIEKEVVGAETEEDFTFTITLKDASGTEITNQYSCIFSRNGVFTESDPIKSGDTFYLKDGESVEIRNLPNGTIATVTETQVDGYSTTYEVGTVSDNDETVTSTGGGLTAEGTVSAEGTTYIKFINTTSYILPATGGRGKYPFQVAGALMLVSSAVLLYELLRRRRLTIKK